MIKSITKESYNEEKNIINYTFGIRTIDQEKTIDSDYNNIIEYITKYSLENCCGYIEPKFVAAYGAISKEEIDGDFLNIQSYPYHNDPELYLFYSIFYNHAVISAYYAATHFNRETKTLNSIFDSMYDKSENSNEYKQYKTFFDTNKALPNIETKSYIQQLIYNMPCFLGPTEKICNSYTDIVINSKEYKSNFDEKKICNSYADIVINSIKNESKFHSSQMKRFIHNSTWTKMDNFNDSLISFGNSYFSKLIYLNKQEDCKYIQSLYEFERYYNIDYIQFIMENYTHILNQDFHFNQKGELFNKLCYLGSLLPNTYSRKCVMANLLSSGNIDSFSDDNRNIVASRVIKKPSEETSPEWLARARKFLLHLIYVAFPLIEKTVFINLYEYFKLSGNKDDNTIIPLMKENLESYINDNAELISYDFHCNDKNKKDKLYYYIKNLPKNYMIPKEILDINPIIRKIKTMYENKVSDTNIKPQEYKVFENIFRSKLFSIDIDKAKKMDLILFYRYLIDLIYTFDMDVKYNRRFSLEYFSYDKITHDFQKLIVDAFMNKDLKIK
ncbi:MAG: hypothetical protein J1F64_05955 [Oscillospiraceae bacterium]|nr:hypothetical protein [Oscillospiraceae bacterium]